MQNPVTMKAVGVVKGWDKKAFSEVRAKSKEVVREHRRKAKRNKKEKIVVPRYDVGDRVAYEIKKGIFRDDGVVGYLEVEVVDIRYSGGWSDEFVYHGIVRRVTAESLKGYLDHIMCVDHYHRVNVDPKEMKWL